MSNHIQLTVYNDSSSRLPCMLVTVSVNRLLLNVNLFFFLSFFKVFFIMAVLFLVHKKSVIN